MTELVGLAHVETIEQEIVITRETAHEMLKTMTGDEIVEQMRLMCEIEPPKWVVPLLTHSLRLDLLRARWVWMQYKPREITP